MPTTQEQRRENATRERRRVQRQSEARAHRGAMASPILCCGCDQLYRREDLNAALFGLFLCGNCTAEARNGSNPVRVTRGVGRVSTRTGRWTARYQSVRAFAGVRSGSCTPLQYTAEPKTSLAGAHGRHPAA